jgi:TfoX/Sxy family transcriptional regulator of competence genes
MKWKKPTPALVEYMEAAVAAYDCEKRPMFGCPSWFVRGNLFAGVFQDSLLLRLSEADRAAIAKAIDEAAPFEPMPGRPMREYVAVPESAAADRAEFARWLARAHAYAAALPPKAKKGAGEKTSAKKR